MGDIKIGGSLGCGGRALVEFTVLRGVGVRGKSKVRTLNFRKANFQLFKELVNRTFRDTAENPVPMRLIEMALADLHEGRVSTGNVDYKFIPLRTYKFQSFKRSLNCQ